MSNFSYFASRTPSATFSKSQNTAMLTLSRGNAMCTPTGGPPRYSHVAAKNASRT
ncbi:hypothetical protein P355_2525 [Burkholderia cenocepacia KC-01]|nr:hypothetical protein P355_2525 [Burkholderia cenocepacia KC-01]